MAKNQENPLPPAIAANPVNQNPAPHTMYDYAKTNLTGTESSIVRLAIVANNFELSQGIKVDPRKIEAILEWKPPRMVSEI